MKQRIEGKRAEGPATQRNPAPQAGIAPRPEIHPILQLQQAAGNQAVQQILQRTRAAGTASAPPFPSTGTDNAILADSTHSPGQPLEPGMRGFMESRFQDTFGDVRIHTDAEAARSADAIGARAYTQGSHIYFGAGEFAAAGTESLRLLAHELTHLQQQRRIPTTGNGDNSLSIDPDAGLERDAERTAEKVISPGAAESDRRGAREGASLPQARNTTIQRQPSGAFVGFTRPYDPVQGTRYDPVVDDETPRTAEKLQAMTNAELLWEISRLNSWLKQERNQPVTIPKDPKTGRPAMTEELKTEIKNWNLLHSTGLHERSWDAEQRHRKQVMDRALAEQKAIATERQRRVSLGYLWLAEKSCDNGIAPAEIYQLRPEANGQTAVVKIADAAAASPAADLGARPQMTPVQFETFRQQHDIKDLSLEDIKQVTGGAGGASRSFFGFDLTPPPAKSSNINVAPFGGTTGVAQNQLYLSGLQRSEAKAFNEPSIHASGKQSGNWIGQRGEFGVKSGSWFGAYTLQDFNSRSWVDTRGGANTVHPASSRNFPILDLRSRTKLSGIPAESLLSVKASARANAADRYRYYAEGLGDIFGVRGQLRGVAAQNLGLTVQELEQNSRLVVNADDAAAFAAALRNPTQPMPGGRKPLYALKEYQAAFDAFFANHPVRITSGAPLYRSVAALEAAQRSGAITTADFTTALDGAGGVMAQAVVANPRATTTAMQNQVALRQTLGTPAEAARVVTPELLPSLEAGGGFSGSSMAALKGGPRGAAAGAGIAVLTDFGMMILDRDNAGPILDRLPHDIGMGALGGSVASVAESGVQSQLSQYFLARAMAGSLPAEGEAMLARSMSRGIGGGLGAAAVEAYEMFSGNAPAHSGVEAGGRLAKAFVLGGVSTEVGAVVGTAASAGTIALLGGEVGATAGSVVPVVGTVVGFLVGLGVGVATYYVLNNLYGPLATAMAKLNARWNAMAVDWTMKYMYGASMGQDPFAQDYMDRMYPPTAGVIVDDKGNVIDTVRPGMKFDKNGYLIESPTDE